MSQSKDDQSILFTFKCPECGARIRVVAQSRAAGDQASQGPVDEATLKTKLGDRYDKDVYVHEVGDELHVAPTHFLGKELWWDLHNMFLMLGAEWVAAGKESHWKVKRRS